MFKPTTGKIVRHTLIRRLAPLYAANLLLIFMSIVTAYVNAAYLGKFLQESHIGLVYAAGSACGILVFLFISRVLQKIGNYRMMFLLLVMNGISLAIIPYVNSAMFAISLFIFHFIAVPILFYSIDVFLEAELDNRESSTGTKRGLLLTLVGLVGAISPLVMSVAVSGDGDFRFVYALAAFTTLPIVAIMLINLSSFKDPNYSELDIFGAIRTFWVTSDIRNVYLCAMILNLYFAFMTVYLPLYLVGEIGLSWSEFGVMISIALLAYLVFEFPVGYIADTYTGEKEFMTLGFLILIGTTAGVAFMSTTSFLPWVILLFVMRIGASIVEVTTESYFFKKTKSSDAQVISFFRTTRPVGYIVVAILASISLNYLPFNLLFVGVAITMLPGIIFASFLHDTK